MNAGQPAVHILAKSRMPSQIKTCHLDIAATVRILLHWLFTLSLSAESLLAVFEIGLGLVARDFQGGCQQVVT